MMPHVRQRISLPVYTIIIVLLVVPCLYRLLFVKFLDTYVKLEPLYYNQLSAEQVIGTYQLHISLDDNRFELEKHMVSEKDPQRICGVIEPLDANIYLLQDDLDMYTQIIALSLSDGSFYFYDASVDIPVLLHPLSSTQN